MLDSGKIDGVTIIDSAYFKQSITPCGIEDAKGVKCDYYGYQWWIPEDATEGEFMARGVYGQCIYSNRPRGVVIATNAADRTFREEGVAEQNIATFRAIATKI